MNLKQEKLDELRNDMLVEQELRQDIDKAISYVETHSDIDLDADLYKLLKHAEHVSSKLKMYGWVMSAEEIVINLIIKEGL